LQIRVNNQLLVKAEAEFASIRKNQVGSGMRGDKIRTYRFQDNKVTDHLTSKSARCSEVLNGKFDLLW
jgi:peptide chain release factor 1